MITIDSRLKIMAAFLALFLVAAALLPLTAEAAGKTITEYGGLTAGSYPEGITSGPGGALWFTEYFGDRIGRIDPSTHAVTEYGLTAGSGPYGITSGPDGALWFTEWGGNQIGRIDPSTQAVNEYVGLTAGSGPFGITSGPDGALWFTEEGGNRIGRIDPSTQAVNEYVGLTAGSYPEGITSGPDGALWFTEESGDRIGRIDPSTHAVTEYGLTAGSGPYGITSGPDGALWFTEWLGNRIGRIDPSTQAVNEYVGLTAGSGPFGITSGPDGALWFAEQGGNRIGRIDPSTQAVNEYVGLTAGSYPEGITSGPAGALWFTEANVDKIGRVSILFTITASVSGGHGTISPSGAVSVNDGADQTFNIAPAAHYHINTLTVDGAPVTPASSYTFHTVTADHTISATFAITTHTITASAGTNGSIAPSGAVSVNDGSDQAFTITPASHYSVATLTVDSTPVTPATSYTFHTVTADHTISATFAITTHTITASAGTNGSIDPSSAVKVDWDADQAFTVTPDANYHVATFKVDGSDATLTGGKYTFTKVEADHTVAATFASDSSTWYLAEGTTAWGFDCYISIENPNSSAVHASITYMTGAGNVSGGTITLPARSQTTVNPADKLGNKDFSTRVTCTEGKTIAVDRTMTWTGPGAASPEGHSSVGVTSPAKTWYLAEGSSQWGFECWLLIQNPNAKTAHCTVTYMIEGQGPKTVSHTVPANSRATFNMADDIGSADASIKVTSNVPVIPERAMYRNNRREGSDSIGTTTPAADYYLAEGATGYNVGYITYVLVQNPQGTPTNVTLTYMTQNGQVAGPSFQMPASSRKTIRVNDQLSPNTDVSTRVHGSKPIIAERAMYWDNGTGEACHDSIGMASAHTTFYLPDGQTSEGRETWTLVQNPNSTNVTVEISYLTPNGQGNVVKTETIPANSRKTFNMASHSGINGRAAIMVKSKTAGKKIMVERAMYWNNRGAGTDTIGGYSD